VLRLFALVMLLANAGYFAWSQGHLRPLGWGPLEQREPERLAQQVAAERLRLEGAASSPPAASATGTSAPASAPTEPTVCQQVSGLSPSQASALTAALGGAGLDSSRWTQEESVLPERWIVYVGKFPSADLLNRKKTELRSLRVEFREVNAPALQPGLALGTYSTEEAAQQALQDVQKAGVRGAKVAQERPDTHTYTVKWPALTPTERAQLNPLGPAFAGKSLQECP